MRLYVKCFFTGTMPGPFAYMRDRLIPCEPVAITEPRVSSCINAVINERAGLTRDRRLVGSYGVVEGKRHNGKTFYWRAYGFDKPLPWCDNSSLARE